jgi:Rho GDP-dissociation inhibitor
MKDVSDAGQLESLLSSPFSIKEDCTYRMKFKFKIENEKIADLKYIQTVKKNGIAVDKMEEGMGSYDCNNTYEKTRKSMIVFISRLIGLTIACALVGENEMPSGILSRSGPYIVRSRFVNGNNDILVDFQWSYRITKDW